MAQRFGRFWLHEQIGLGGMAEVFRATLGPDPNTYAFEVALKRLLPQLLSDPTQVDMFVTEADVAKLLKHPNLVQVYEAGLVESQPYIVMEYVWGLDLATLIEQLKRRRLRFPSDLAVHVALQMLRALDYVHGATTAAGAPMDIVHRDVTPQNVFVTFDGQVKLGDFGVARVNFLEGVEEQRFLKGKVPYMPPEVLAGRAQVDTASDLWGVAVTLYEMLTARRLFEGASEEELLAGKLPRIVPVHQVNSDIDERLGAIVTRALSPKRKARPRDAVELYQALKRYLLLEGIQVDASALARFVGAVGPPRPPTAAPRGQSLPKNDAFEGGYQVPLVLTPTQRFEAVRRRRMLLGPVLGVVLGLALLVGVLWMTRPKKPSPAPPPVQQQAAPAPVLPLPELPRRPLAEDMIEFADDLGEDLGKLPPETEQLPRDPVARFRALMHRGSVQVQRKRFQTAEEAYGQAIELRPKNVPALLGRANALLELDRHAEAEQLVRSALQIDGKNARAFLLLGDILWVQGKDEPAKQAYKRTTELDKGKIGQTAKRILDGL